MDIVKEENPGNTHKRAQWLRRLGVAGVAFFLVKGMLWIAASLWLLL